MAALGTLSIGTRRFGVQDATLSAAVAGEGSILWNVEVDARGARAYIEQYPSTVRNFAELFATPWTIPSGREFAGGTILPGQPLCALYVVEHEFLDNTLVQFAPGDGRFLRVAWSSTCSGASVRIEARVEFLGFAVTARSQRAAETLMARTFDTTGLTYHREDGESFFIP